MINSNLNTLAQMCHNVARERGFWDRFGPEGPDADGIGTMLALIHSEVTEALEELRAAGDPTERFAVELTDVIIRVFDLAAGLNLDLDKAFDYKMKKNVGRPKLHGKHF